MIPKSVLLSWLKIFFFVLPGFSFGQSGWETILFDENVSFSFPSKYTRSDTLGQINFLGSTADGFLQAVKIPQPQAQILNEKALLEYYEAFQKLALERSYGELVLDSTIELNGLHARVFEFESYWNDSLEVQENLIIFVNRTMYSFTYAYFKNEKEKVLKERDSFFSGIVTYSVSFDDQLTIPKRKGAERAGELVGYTLRYVILGTLILSIILWYYGKYHVVEKIKNISSLVFLTWGGANLFLYVGNIFFGSKAYSLLLMGGIFLIVGFVLRKIKVPVRKV